MVLVMNKGQYSGSVGIASSESGIIASITEYTGNNFNGELHYHKNAHISFVLHGGCAEKKQDRYERLPGMLTHYSACEPHQVLGVAPFSKHINIELEPEFFNTYEVSDSTLHTAVAKNPESKFLMIKLYADLVAYDAHSMTSIKMTLLNLVGQTVRWQNKCDVPQWVKLVHAYLMDNWDTFPSLQQLSIVAGVHPVHVSKYFPLYFACTLGEFMRKIKIDKAIRLIKFTNEPLTSIAYMCGFTDQSHFIRSFKLHTGYSPSAFRKLS